MAQLKDTVITGSARVTDTLYTNDLVVSGSKTARYALIAPTSDGAPTWRALTNADVGLGNVENTKLSTWQGTSNVKTLGTITTGTWNATIVGVAYGGTGVNSSSTAINKVFASPSSGSAGAPSFRTLVAADVPAITTASDTTNELYMLGVTSSATTTVKYNSGVKAKNGAVTATTYNGLTLTAATTGFTIAGGTTSKTLTVSNTYTLGAACAYSVDDATANGALGTGTGLTTERSVYYGLCTVNNASQTRATSIYAPTGAGTAGQFLKASGSNTAPVWADLSPSITTTRTNNAPTTTLSVGGKTSNVHSAIVDLIYPIGSIYLSVTSTSPATLFGGTWVQLKDKFLLGMGDTGTVEDTGGASSVSYTPAGTNSGGAVGNHTLTTAEIPSHNHTFTGSAVTSGNNSVGHTHTFSTGNQSGTHNHWIKTGGISANHWHWRDNHAHNLSYWTDSSWHGGGSTLHHAPAQGSSYMGSTMQGAGGGWSGIQDVGHTHSGWTDNNNGNHTHSGTTDGISANHTHSVTAEGTIGNTGDGGAHNHGFTQPTFSGTAATIATMPPYIKVYMWKRTA